MTNKLNDTGKLKVISPIHNRDDKYSQCIVLNNPIEYDDVFPKKQCGDYPYELWVSKKIRDDAFNMFRKFILDRYNYAKKVTSQLDNIECEKMKRQWAEAHNIELPEVTFSTEEIDPLRYISAETPVNRRPEDYGLKV